MNELIGIPPRITPKDWSCVFIGGSNNWAFVFFNSLDAMQKAVLMQEEFQCAFHEILFRKCLRNPAKSLERLYFHKLTYTDWQEAFIEVLNQRKEKK